MGLILQLSFSSSFILSVLGGFRFYPSRHGMVSPHRLSVRKDWPEYKNIISFVKRRTQTRFNGKNNPSLFQESVGGEEEDSVTQSLRRLACRVRVSTRRGVTERSLLGRRSEFVSSLLLGFYVLITPLPLGRGLGRQGSSGSGSWANTESSPEEQVLFES